MKDDIIQEKIEEQKKLSESSRSKTVSREIVQALSPVAPG